MNLFHLYKFLLPSLILIFSACGSPHSNKITIATAANMQFVMQELSDVFTDQFDIPCNLVISSSGKLTAQIMEGAPYDIFVAANMKYPEEIYKNDLALKAPEVYAHGQLVLWSMIEGLEPSLENLDNTPVKHIALANPKTAPYGMAAEEALRNSNLLKPLRDKLVFGESIAQVNQFITSESAEVGFTAMSVVLSAQMKGQGKWTKIDSKIYPPIAQGVLLLNSDRASSGAQSFYDFLFSAEARRILKDFGYLVDE